MANSNTPHKSNAPDEDSIRQADADYKSFPSFHEWSSATIDETRWNKYSSKIEQDQNIPENALRNALNIARRAAAVDTGALEGLYEVDRGFTFTVAAQGATWEAALQGKSEEAVALIKSQLHTYDLILDAATHNMEISEAFIRRIHEELCRNQKTYIVHTPLGIQKHELPLGEYKHLPNHVLKSDGKVHSYCPVELVPAEMSKLCLIMRSKEFQDAHPALQASFAHYSLVVIHPFADGNGRVARALASIYFLRAFSIPLLILAESKKEYFVSLEAADAGHSQSFIDFILHRGLDAFSLIHECIEAAMLPSIRELSSEIENLYITRGGYTHEQVDAAGLLLLKLFYDEFVRQKNETLKSPHIIAELRLLNVGSSSKGSYRIPNSTQASSNGFHVTLNTPPPATAQFTSLFNVEVPMDCGTLDDLFIKNNDNQKVFEARITELIPQPTSSLQMRITIGVGKVIASGMLQLKESAYKKLSRNK
jgi:Fic family protein